MFYTYYWERLARELVCFDTWVQAANKNTPNYQAANENSPNYRVSSQNFTSQYSLSSTVLPPNVLLRVTKYSGVSYFTLDEVVFTWLLAHAACDCTSQIALKPGIFCCIELLLQVYSTLQYF